MPKYYPFKVAGYFLYFTSKCIVECMHVHASDSKLTEEAAAKFFVKADGTTEVTKKGNLNDRDINKIRGFIRENYLEMYSEWEKYSDKGFYKG